MIWESFQNGNIFEHWSNRITDHYEIILSVLTKMIIDFKGKCRRQRSCGGKTSSLNIEKTLLSQVIKGLIKIALSPGNYFGKTKSLLFKQTTKKVKKINSQSLFKSRPIIVQENFVFLTNRKPDSDFVPRRSWY